MIMIGRLNAKRSEDRLTIEHFQHLKRRHYNAFVGENVG